MYVVSILFRTHFLRSSASIIAVRRLAIFVFCFVHDWVYHRALSDLLFPTQFNQFVNHYLGGKTLWSEGPKVIQKIITMDCLQSKSFLFCFDFPFLPKLHFQNTLPTHIIPHPNFRRSSFDIIGFFNNINPFVMTFSALIGSFLPSTHSNSKSNLPLQHR